MDPNTSPVQPTSHQKQGKNGTAAFGQDELPGRAELQQILQAEDKRGPAPGKESTHYPEFETVIRLLDHYGVDAALFRDTSAGDIQTVIAAAQSVVAELAGKLVVHSPSPAAHRLVDEAYDYLTEEDEPKPSDMITVFGSNFAARAKMAADHYRLGLAPTILISGSNPWYAQRPAATEAERFRQVAVEAGVPESVFILEDRSITLIDNVRRSLNLLDEMGRHPQSFILVISPYAQRRAYISMLKYVPDGVRLYRVNSDCEPGR